MWPKKKPANLEKDSLEMLKEELQAKENELEHAYDLIDAYEAKIQELESVIAGLRDGNIPITTDFTSVIRWLRNNADEQHVSMTTHERFVNAFYTAIGKYLKEVKREAISLAQKKVNQARHRG